MSDLVTTPQRRAAALAATSAAAAAGFGLVARAVARRDTASTDAVLRPQVAAPRHTPTRRAASAIAPLGKWYVNLPAAIGFTAYALAQPTTATRRRRARREAGDGAERWPALGAVALAGVLPMVLGPLFDRVLPQPPAPPGHASPAKPVFPSGHALGTGATAFTAAYVLVREGRARPLVALPVALAIPLVSAGGKLLEEKHWASDVLGGVLAAAAVAAGCLASYELARRR